MAKHTAEELAVWQRLPLEIKERMSMTRIRGWISEYGIDGVYISTSGGKDSTVLSDLVHRTVESMGWEDTIPRVFVNTGLEHPSVRLFAQKQINSVTLRPAKTFRQVLTDYGYPVPSKEVSEKIDASRKYIDDWERQNKILTDRQTDRHVMYAHAIADILGLTRLGKEGKENLRLLKQGIIPNNLKFKYKIPVRALSLLGKVPHTEKGEPTAEYSNMCDKSRWAWLLDAPFKISNQCCDVMKKAPLHKYQHQEDRCPFVGTMAEESILRRTQWLKHGCNLFDAKLPLSKPLSFWTEQDILQYIKKYNLKIAEAYGDVIVKTDGEVEGQMTIQEVLEDYRECKLTTTKEKRTGCIFCMFGINQDKERFKRLSETEPKLCDFVMRGGEVVNDNWQPNDKGLGYWFVLEWLNINGNMNIYIPDRERYIKEYSTPETKELLKKVDAYDNE